MKPRASLVFNPASGRGRAEDLDDILARLEGHFTVQVFRTSRDEDADACTRRALGLQPDVVIAAGGDGTVSGAASVLVGTPTPLAILPRGTASSIALGLGIGTELIPALDTLIRGVVQRIDTARCGDRSVVLLASVGFHADAVGGTSRASKNKWGPIAYVASALKQLRELNPFTVHIQTESEVIQCKATAVTVANIAPGRTLLAQGPSRVSPDDGILDVTIIAATSLTEAVATGLHLLRTAAELEPASRDNVGFFGCRRLRLTTDPPQHVLVDGEPAGLTPLEMECLPGSLSVYVPGPLPPRAQAEEKLQGLPDLSVQRR